jgi:hypothetical protein
MFEKMVKRNAMQGLGVRVPTGVDLPMRRGADECGAAIKRVSLTFRANWANEAATYERV